MYKFCSFEFNDNFAYSLIWVEALYNLDISCCVAISNAKTKIIIDLTKMSGDKRNVLNDLIEKGTDIENVEYK